MGQPSWLDKRVNPTTRARSGAQESNIAKKLKGRTTANSGATFGENDVTTDYAEIEAKTTNKDSYSLKLSEFAKATKKTKLGKFPIMVIQFESRRKSLAVLDYNDLVYLINCANAK